MENGAVNRQYDGKTWGPTIHITFAPRERVVIGTKITTVVL